MSLEPQSVRPDDRVGALAARVPAATRVFERYKIDYCCAGARTLAEAAAAKGVDVATVVDALNREAANDDVNAARWASMPLSELIAYIVENHHRPLDTELPRLMRMAQRVLEVHGDRDRARLTALLDVLHDFSTEMFDHMLKEERVLFPMIVRGEGRIAMMPISVMEAEHEHIGKLLAELRRLTDDFVAPQGACATWRGLWLGLADLERRTHEHVHLENNVCFPRAIVQ
jgi:regulator of cell morphogenesis and NO signaling